MADFFGMVKNELNHDDANKILTENGAVAYASIGDTLVDFEYSANNLRNKTPEQIKALFERCYNDNPVMATKMLFHMGDVREGKGERRTFNTCLKYLAEAHPEIAKAVLPLVPEYTRWDHVAELAISGDPTVQKFARQYIAEQLKKDYETAKQIDADNAERESIQATIEKTIHKKDRDVLQSMIDNIPHRELSLCAKWTPALGSKKPGHHKIALKIAHEMGLSNKEYRQMRSTITNHLNMMTRYLSEKRLDESMLENASSGEWLKSAEAIKKTLGEEKYNEYIEKVQKGEANMNASVLTPADVVHRYTKEAVGFFGKPGVKAYDATLEELWKHLPKIESENNTGIIVVRDDSGSMTVPVSKDTEMTCLEVATAFSIYCAEQLEGPYKNQFLSFSAHPKYMDISKFDTLHDKLVYCAQHSEISNTNIEATFDLLLKTAVNNHLTQDQIPGCVLIFSDMEFDAATDGRPNAALFENIRDKWQNAGYEMPVCAFWNLNTQRSVVPSVDERGVVLLGGFTKDNLDLLMSGELAKFTPTRQLELTLSKPRYDAVEKAFNDGIQAERMTDAKYPRTAISYAEYLSDNAGIRVDAVEIEDIDDYEYDDDYDDHEDWDW